MLSSTSLVEQRLLLSLFPPSTNSFSMPQAEAVFQCCQLNIKLLSSFSEDEPTSFGRVLGRVQYLYELRKVQQMICLSFAPSHRFVRDGTNGYQLGEFGPCFKSDFLVLETRTMTPCKSVPHSGKIGHRSRICGAVLDRPGQILFLNPLASPYLEGVISNSDEVASARSATARCRKNDARRPVEVLLASD